MSEFLIYGLIAAIGSVLGSTISSITNGVSTKQTNEANKELAEEANAAQAAESEKAYRRSMPTNQVANLRAAGMSHAGALNVLSGGGSYTPAPVNTAQMQSFSMENPLAGAADIVAGMGTNSAQMKQNKEQFKQQLDFQKQVEEQRKREEQRRLDMEEQRMYDDFANSAIGRELTSAQIKVAAKQLDVSDAQLKKLVADEQLTLAQIQTETAKYHMTLAQIADIKEHTKLTTQEILNAKETFNNIREDTELKKIQWDKIFQDKEVSKQTSNKLFEEYLILCEQYDRLTSPQGQLMWNNEVEMSKLAKQSAEFNNELLRLNVIDEQMYQDFLGYKPNDPFSSRVLSNNLRLYSTLLGPLGKMVPLK